MHIYTHTCTTKFYSAEEKKYKVYKKMDSSGKYSIKWPRLRKIRIPYSLLYVDPNFYCSVYVIKGM